MKSPELTLELLITEAKVFAINESEHHEKSLFGVTDGKAIGTYLEHRFEDYLENRYHFARGCSASGIDLPQLGVDIKTTSITQPQSSCPFKSARQKIYGLGYALLVFVYEKIDDRRSHTGTLNLLHVIFVKQECTADYQTTSGIVDILKRQGNEDDLVGFMSDKNLPLDEIQAHQLALEILKNPPAVGYLTISNALQWRLQYSRVIEWAGDVNGLIRVK